MKKISFLLGIILPVQLVAQVPDWVNSVDLGLPSGNLWASCNLQAGSDSSEGGFYAWGELNDKYPESYKLETYAFYVPATTDADGFKVEAYCNCESIGDCIAGTEYDPVTYRWGSEWTTPTVEEAQELIRNCTCTYTDKDGVHGMKIVGPNGNWIFIPAAGWARYKKIEWDQMRSSCHIATSTKRYEHSRAYVNFVNNASIGSCEVWAGEAIRPVKRASSAAITEVTTDKDTETKTFDLIGNQTNIKDNGLYIVKTGNKTRKVLIK